LIEHIRAIQSLYNSRLYEKEAKKRCVVRLDLKVCKVLDGGTSDAHFSMFWPWLAGKLGRLLYRAVCSG